MFHLLVHRQGWRGTRGDLAEERVFEFSSDAAIDFVQRDGTLDLGAVTQIPALFMTEIDGPGTDEVRIGRIIGVRTDDRRVTIDYMFENQPRFRRSDVRELAAELGIEGAQLTRTHWAVMEGDLYRVLYERRALQPPPAATAAPAAQMREAGDPRKVFIIHGRDLTALRQVEAFLRACGLDPIEFDQLRAKMGGTPTIADIVTRGMSEAHGIIALFTPDEWSTLAPELRGPKDSGEAIERWQARPNVIFEAGMAFGRDRERVILVTLGSPALFTDVAGIHVFDLSNAPKVRAGFRSTLRGMGLTVNDSNAWLEAGDFELANVTRPRSNAPALAPMSDLDARIRLKAWLATLPQNQGTALEFSAIAETTRVPIAQVRALLPGVVGTEPFSWTIQEAGDEMVLLSYYPF